MQGSDAECASHTITCCVRSSMHTYMACLFEKWSSANLSGFRLLEVFSATLQGKNIECYMAKNNVMKITLSYTSTVNLAYPNLLRPEVYSDD